MKIQSLLFLFLVATTQSFASSPSIEANQLYGGADLSTHTLESIASGINPGSIVILSEIHDNLAHHEKQVQFLEALAAAHPNSGISVGMEFIEYPYQEYVPLFLQGALPENEFLKLIHWSDPSNFPLYRRQVRFPAAHQGTTLGINAPRALTSKVAKQGLDSLTSEERAYLSPRFTLGNAQYEARFSEQMSGGHVPASKIANYFASQSIWDDTMAWRSTEFLRHYPDQILLIIVGDFHNIYGGGLPDRIQAHGFNRKNLVTISQINLNGLSSDESLTEVAPDPRWGQRADYVWTSDEAKTHSP